MQIYIRTDGTLQTPQSHFKLRIPLHTEQREVEVCRVSHQSSCFRFVGHTAPGALDAQQQRHFLTHKTGSQRGKAARRPQSEAPGPPGPAVPTRCTSSGPYGPRLKSPLPPQQLLEKSEGGFSLDDPDCINDTQNNTTRTKETK